MAELTDKTRDFEQRYSPDRLQRLREVRPSTADTTFQMLDELDHNFAKIWLNYVTGMNRWSLLDRRTTLLVQTAQFTCLKDQPALSDAITSALAGGVRVREILEVILQCIVTAGESVLGPALEVFSRIIRDAGLQGQLQATQLPLDGRDHERSLEGEAESWHPEDAADPRREPLQAKYGWLGISTGMRLRPKHMLDLMEYVDSLDPKFAEEWLAFSYHGMYSRILIDDKTRLLCQAANCIAIGATNQARAHIRGAMREGASAGEVMEMITQGIVHLGMPKTFGALKVFTAILEEDGRLGELGTPILAEKLQKAIG